MSKLKVCEVYYKKKKKGINKYFSFIEVDSFYDELNMVPETEREFEPSRIISIRAVAF